MTDSEIAAHLRPGVERPAGLFTAATSNGAVTHPAPGAPPPRAGPGCATPWPRSAVLAAAAAVVSWDAQYVMVRPVKHAPAVAALEAGDPRRRAR